MEMRQLRYFVAVAEELSFTRAAAHLHVSQPPVSRQIMLLEQEIGVPLFERSKQYVRLTPAGHHFHDEARALLLAASNAVATTRRVATGQVGRLSLGLGGTAAYVLTDVLSKFRRRYPEVQLALNPLNLAYHQEALMDERIDIGLLILPNQNSELDTRMLTRIRLIVAMPTGHPLSTHRSLSLKALAEQDFVMVPWAQGQGFGRLIMKVCRKAGFSPQIVQEAEPMESVVGMVAAGAGIAIVPQSMQQLHLRKVVYRPIEESYAVADIAVAWRKTGFSPIVQALLSCCPAPEQRRRTAS